MSVGRVDGFVDMGPRAATAALVAQGAPEDIAASAASHTGRFLREVLKRRPLIGAGAADEGEAGREKRRAAKPAV